MALKNPIYHEFDLNATSGNSRVISLTHTDDAHVDVIELCVKQQGAVVDLTGATVVARMVLHSTADILLNDSVSCTINDAGNILIPFDNAAVQTRKGIVKIEVNITRTPDILTLQLPLWVKINGSILDDATVDPHSEGTIPELLKDAADALEEATQALEGAKDYDKLNNKPQINSHTLSGNQSSDDLGLQKKLTAGQNITLESDGTISASGGVTSYNDLSNLPAFLGFRAPYYEDRVEFKGEFHIPNFTLTLGEDNKYHMALSRVYGNTIVEGSTPFEIFTTAVQKAIWKDYGEYNNPPADLFTNYSVAPAKNGIWHISVNTLAGLPVPASGRLMNYYCGGERVQIYATDVFDPRDARYQYGGRYFARTEKGGILGTWRELGGGSQIVSGVVNQNGTITFTDSDGNTFTTSGSKLVTSGSEQISMGYDSGGFYFLFDDGQEAS